MEKNKIETIKALISSKKNSAEKTKQYLDGRVSAFDEMLNELSEEEE